MSSKIALNLSLAVITLSIGLFALVVKKLKPLG